MQVDIWEPLKCEIVGLKEVLGEYIQKILCCISGEYGRMKISSVRRESASNDNDNDNEFDALRRIVTFGVNYGVCTDC